MAASGLAYELVIGTLGSYLRGDTTGQFAISFGVFTAGLGLGAALSRRLPLRPWALLAVVEFLLCAYGLFIAGLCSSDPRLALGNGSAVEQHLALAALLGGVLVGLELPVIAALLGDFGGTMALDYAGALLASWLFPFVLMPAVGLVGTAMWAGAANGVVGLVCVYYAFLHARSAEAIS